MSALVMARLVCVPATCCWRLVSRKGRTRRSAPTSLARKRTSALRAWFNLVWVRPMCRPSASNRVAAFSRCVRRPEGRATRLVRSLSSQLLRLPQRHARARRFRDETALLIGDAALREADRLPALHHAPFGDEQAGPHRPQEIDLQLQRREALAVLERARIGESHRRIR